MFEEARRAYSRWVRHGGLETRMVQDEPNPTHLTRGKHRNLEASQADGSLIVSAQKYGDGWDLFAGHME